MSEHELVVGDHPAVKKMNRALSRQHLARLMHAGALMICVAGALIAVDAIQTDGVTWWRIWFGFVGNGFAIFVNVIFFLQAHRRIRALAKAKINLLSWFVAPTHNLSEHCFEQAEAALEEAIK